MITLMIPIPKSHGQLNRFLRTSSLRKDQLSPWEERIVSWRHPWDSANPPVLLCPTPHAALGHVCSNDSDQHSSHSHGQCLPFTEHLSIHQLKGSFQSPERGWGQADISISQQTKSRNRVVHHLASGEASRKSRIFTLSRASFSGALHL